jgi:hypothetical protein
MLLNNRLRQWLQHIPMTHGTRARRSTTRRRMAMIGPPAEVVEVLENRLLLSADFLRFAVQPSNGIAGHPLSSFTVDVLHTVRFRGVPLDVIDTSYNGLYSVTANGSGGLVTPTVPPTAGIVPGGQPLTFLDVIIHNGVGRNLASFDLAALDVAGTYTLTVTSPAGEGNPGVPGSAVSSNFTISPDAGSDHLVFLNLSSPFALIPTTVTVAVEDQFGNVDTSVSNVPVYLFAVPGNTSTAVLNNGQATFHNVIFAGLGTDTVVAYGFRFDSLAQPFQFFVGVANVEVLPLPPLVG